MLIDKEIMKNLKDNGLLKAGVYTFYNKQTGYYYIGSSCELERRIRDHRRQLENNQHVNNKFQNVYNKNSNFEIALIPMSNRTEALSYEDFLIKKRWNDPKLLNLAPDAQSNNLGIKSSDETKDKKSKAMLEFYKNGGQNPMQGKKHPPEIKEMLSELAKKQFSDPQNVEAARQRTLNSFKDPVIKQKHKEATIKAMSDQNIKDKMSSSNALRWSDEEERAKQSQRCIERFSDISNRSICSNAGKAAWANTEFREKMCIKVSIDGTVYESIIDAARNNNVCDGTVRNRIESNNPIWENWIYV